MTPNEVRDIFNQVYNGQANFMTPEITGHGSAQSGRYLYELSEGRGIYGDRIYGFTVLIRTDEGYKRCRDKSQLCHSATEQRACVTGLRQYSEEA